MPHNMDEPLRKLGMPVSKRGVVTLIKPFTVCQEKILCLRSRKIDSETFQLQAGRIQADLELLQSEGTFYKL